MDSIPKIPDIPDEERTPWVTILLELCHQLREWVQKLKDENARLKGQKARPSIAPSCLNKEKKEKEPSRRPPHSGKRKKKVAIHRTVKIKPPDLPQGSRFKGYQDYTVQEIEFQVKNTLFRLERWKTPEGRYLVGELPSDIDGHFGPFLQCYILYQHHHCHVTQPLILEQLHEWGIEISAGEINNILIKNKEDFHQEKMDILKAGLQVSPYIQSDDTGARHDGDNGYCTHIGNESFAWFASTRSKSRINFLELLRAGHEDYVLNAGAFDYMEGQKLPRNVLEDLKALPQKSFDAPGWKMTISLMTSERHIRIATEGALLGSALEHGLNPDLAVMSDDAGQFNILTHVLCWIHAERTVKKLIGFSEEQQEALGVTLDRIWCFYRELKSYKLAPLQEKKGPLSQRFDEIFLSKTCFVSLNKALERIYKNKEELLRVLDRPELPLHNNLSEGDIRDYVKKRKISGSTRSEEGRRCRDTFASLKKTCRKQKVSFWKYLQDRIFKHHALPLLSEMIPGVWATSTVSCGV